MSKVRMGIIGLGNIGRHHAAYLSEGKVLNCELAAVCSSSAEKREQFKDAQFFADPQSLIRSKAVDAVLIATPHYQHTTLGIDALENGLHLIVEKPISAHKADAERLIAAHRTHPSLTFAAMFQFRVEPRYIEIRRILSSGEIGRLVRVSWIMTDWFRTEAYYASGGWRATWKGEGGGVLLNQCLHNLDTLQWLLGMPSRVRGFCKLGAHHDIEVEDDITAYFEYENGATGTVISSTGESPGSNRLEIAGTKGRILLDNDRLLLTRNSEDSAEFSRNATKGFARPESETREVPVATNPDAHATIVQNFVDSILNGKALIAPGEDGIHSVELANAILLSSLKDKTLQLPLDSREYTLMLESLIAGSTKEKRVVAIADENIATSFKR
jgi:predicted dehydrogenase